MAARRRARPAVGRHRVLPRRRRVDPDGADGRGRAGSVGETGMAGPGAGDRAPARVSRDRRAVRRRPLAHRGDPAVHRAPRYPAAPVPRHKLPAEARRPPSDSARALPRRGGGRADRVARVRRAAGAVHGMGADLPAGDHARRDGDAARAGHRAAIGGTAIVDAPSLEYTGDPGAGRDRLARRGAGSRAVCRSGRDLGGALPRDPALPAGEQPVPRAVCDEEGAVGLQRDDPLWRGHGDHPGRQRRGEHRRDRPLADPGHAVLAHAGTRRLP